MTSKKSTPAGKKQNLSTISSTNFDVFTSEQFISEACELKKKYPNIGEDFHRLLKELKKDPITGNKSLGMDCYKVRLHISDKRTGERDGGRVIVKVKIIDHAVYLVSVYDKSEKSNFEGELDKLLSKMIIKHERKKIK